MCFVIVVKSRSKKIKDKIVYIVPHNIDYLTEYIKPLFIPEKIISSVILFGNQTCLKT